VQLGRRLGFDFGDVRIGVAVSDPSGILATPIARILNTPETFNIEITQLFAEYQPLYIALGFPLHLSGTEGAKSESVLTFARRISTISQAPIYLIDERLSTVSATKILREKGLNSKEARNEVDSVAAAAILEAALNQERLQGAPMNRFEI
jgi:putative holliday junction resolvase